MTTEPTPNVTGTGGRQPLPDSDAVPLQIRMQILSTEHWSLLATRSLAWNETFTRAGMFLSTLSFAVVALALVGQASGFGQDFRIFALIVLPVVLFLGIATALRMDTSNYNDLLCVIGMNRIRAGYLEIAPDLERFFIAGHTDDYQGIVKTMGGMPSRSLAVELLSASPVILVVLNAMLVASIVGLALIQLSVDQVWAMVAGALGFFITVAIWTMITMRTLTGLQVGFEPLFPTNPRAAGDGQSSSSSE